MLGLLIGYPLAYMIAFKAGPAGATCCWCSVIAPFFTSFILRTLAWRQILGEEGVRRPARCKALHMLPQDMAAHRDARSR